MTKSATNPPTLKSLRRNPGSTTDAALQQEAAEAKIKDEAAAKKS